MREVFLEYAGAAGKVNAPRVPRMSEFERGVREREEQTWGGTSTTTITAIISPDASWVATLVETGETGIERELRLEKEGEAGKVNIPRVPRMSEFEREVKKHEEETWGGTSGFNP